MSLRKKILFLLLKHLTVKAPEKIKKRLKTERG